MEFLSKCPDLWFGVFRVPPKGIPITPHYLSLGMALDIAVIADSNSILDCQKCSKKSSLLLLYVQVLFKMLKNSCLIILEPNLQGYAPGCIIFSFHLYNRFGRGNGIFPLSCKTIHQLCFPCGTSLDSSPGFPGGLQENHNNRASKFKNDGRLVSLTWE